MTPHALHLLFDAQPHKDVREEFSSLWLDSKSTKEQRLAFEIELVGRFYQLCYNKFSKPNCKQENNPFWGHSHSIETIETIDDSLNSVAIFSHNPGITEFVNTLTKTQIDDMPTCGIFAVEIDITSWKSFKKASKKFLFFDYPKSV